MSKVFYDHLVCIEEMVIEIDNYEIPPEERDELLALIDESFHQRLLGLILGLLPQDRHQDFLTQFYQAPGESSLLEFLKNEVKKDIDEAISLEAKKIKKEILAEIRKSNK